MTAQPSQGIATSPLPGIQWIKLAEIDTEDQVRTSMDQEALAELAEDIKAHGLLQPITVRPKGKRYTVIYGHRRRFACEMAGLRQVPAIVGAATAAQVTELQIAENLHREELSPADLGKQLVKLYQEHASLDTVALIVNKSKAWVAKRIKFGSESIWHECRTLFEEGVTEDLELLLALDQLSQVSFDEAKLQAQLLRDPKGPAVTREKVRQLLKDWKAKNAAQRKAQDQAYKTRCENAEKKRKEEAKAAEAEPRSMWDMSSELEDMDPAEDKVNEIAANWTEGERSAFYAAVRKAWAEGLAIENAAQLALATTISEGEACLVARMLGAMKKPLNPDEQGMRDHFDFEMQRFLQLRRDAEKE
jgi:ParB/RepB/Spo0J family partition protein